MLSPNDLFEKISPYFGKKVFPPTFFMEHLLQGLYGVDAPASGHNSLRSAEFLLKETT
jgi:hypothetical protein